MKNYFLLVVKWIIAIILLQTLYFKFSGSPESVYIFKKLGVEPYGRIGSGIIELAASILLFINKTKFFGAIISASTMLGAICTHIFIIGIEVMNDNGTLFILALITFILSLFLIYTYGLIEKHIED
ncbi:DoxX family membrane protein [Flavobacterium difficile]|uniref:DoxX family protein n=1 Tax=Flavobacterium difficile TaxID=2709659 RepID=A0ABX0I550_9FLAO|nr:DoxX family protein [Flavobacterium difficile]NHM01984.1 DoxX family protein [Flavobacterium difficile]